MKPHRAELAVLAQPAPGDLELSGAWTARGVGPVDRAIGAVRVPADTAAVVNCAGVQALDTTGAWVLQRLLSRLRVAGVAVSVQGLQPGFATRLAVVAPLAGEQGLVPVSSPGPPPLDRLGRRCATALEEGGALLAFIGESSVALAGCLACPARIRWRPVLYNIRSAGFEALPIVALLAFMLGVVVAYQGAGQLRQYGANIFVADLIGLSMLREFAPLITAIIIAGRSGSAYAAQIGTMAVTEEIDAMRTLGIAPLELLVLPKVAALLIALPLLTVCADVLGVIGGMVMAKVQLGVGYGDFLDRFVKAVSPTAYLVGVGKAPVFAGIISIVGCFQGFRTKGGADSVGRQTTRAVVQTIFLVIVADGLFSVAFSVLDL
jgi:phospholipid/cholesterol/gamma-HCH transport system permease protein